MATRKKAAIDPDLVKDPTTGKHQRAIDQFYDALTRAKNELDEATRDRFVGKAGPRGETIAWTDGHRAVLVPGEPENILGGGNGWDAVAATRPYWVVPPELHDMTKRALVFAKDVSKASNPIIVEYDGARLWLRAGDSVECCCEWVNVDGDRAAGVLTVNASYLAPIAALAAAGVLVTAQWTPDADDPIVFTLPTRARYIIQPLKMKRTPAAVAAAEGMAA